MYSNTSLIRRAIHAILLQSVFLVDTQINHEVLIYIIDGMLAGYIVSAALAIVMCYLTHLIAVTTSTKQYFKTLLASLLACVEFAVLMVCQVEIEHGIMPSIVLIILFLTATLYSIVNEEDKIKNGPARRKRWIEMHLPELKAETMELERKLDRERDNLLRDAENNVIEIQKATENALQENTKVLDALKRAQRDESKRIKLLLKKVNRGIDDAYDSFGEPELV